jgi:prepilin peptidase CpaA
MPSAISSDVLVVMMVIAAGTAAAAIDLSTRRVPNTLTGGLALLGLLLAVSGHGRIGAGAAVAGCLIGLALMLPGHLFGATGGGDVKLLAAFGMLLGPADTLAAFLISAIAGGVLALGVAVHRGRVRETLGSTVRVATHGRLAAHESGAHNTFAYAPAIALGAALAAIGV